MKSSWLTCLVSIIHGRSLYILYSIKKKRTWTMIAKTKQSCKKDDKNLTSRFDEHSVCLTSKTGQSDFPTNSCSFSQKCNSLPNDSSEQQANRPGHNATVWQFFKIWLLMASVTHFRGEIEKNNICDNFTELYNCAAEAQMVSQVFQKLWGTQRADQSHCDLDSAIFLHGAIGTVSRWTTRCGTSGW